MDYFSVSIIEEPAIAFLELSDNGTERYTDINGLTIEPVAEQLHYIYKNWLMTREAWMQPLPEPPAKAAIISPLEFLQLFTPQERIVIRAAAKANAMLEDFLDLLSKASEVNLSHEATVQGVTVLEKAGILAEGRAATILSGG